MTNRDPENLLLVEGHDDQHLVGHFCEKKLGDKLICEFRNKDINGNDNDRPVLYVQQRDGFGGIIRRIPDQVKPLNLKRLGIMLDADDSTNGILNHIDKQNRKSNWQKLKAKLEEVLILENYDLPECPPQEGLILHNITPEVRPSPTLRVGVWMMPDNESPGELENFFAKLIPAANPSWALAKEYIDKYMQQMNQAENQQGSFDTQNPYKLSKAEVHAWLATREEPGKMGAAISSSHGLDFDSELARRFARWLENLFCS